MRWVFVIFFLGGYSSGGFSFPMQKIPPLDDGIAVGYWL